MRPYLIGIAGPSGAGKSCLAGHVAARLDALLINLDSYYCELTGLSYEERCRVNFDDPASIDFPLLLEHARSLAGGRGVEAPIYDFATHARRPETLRCEPRAYVIVEGLFTLHWPELRALLSTKVFVDLEDNVCFRRRLERDVRERGRTPESVKTQYDETVRPMAERYVRPTRQFADLVIAGDATLETSADTVLEHMRQQQGSAARHPA
jgi:uridine kinase